MKNFKDENSSLKELVVELSLENITLKKNFIRLAEQSDLLLIQTLRELKVNMTSFYKWINNYYKNGYDGFKRKKKTVQSKSFKFMKHSLIF